MNIASEVAQRLLQIKAIKLSPQKPFTWASGILSPIYCDNRLVLSHPEVRDLVKQCLIEKAKDFGKFDSVAGVATAGIAHGMLLADALNLPFAYVRSKPKEHGRQNLIEGELPAKSKVLVVEDLISTGGSSLQAVDAVRASGHEVVGVLAIFSYNFEKAIRAFESAGCQLETLSNYDILLREALSIKYINLNDVDMLTTWRQKTGS
ncbi:MAG: orotate phosphoribosyltransferase [Saprospiraceae bacterium]|nr:orotate phosphoribosyltransferase [Saprospiraceae bacterium]MCF8250455.1 orotate phosphoribosyltransferase [Saprospiraceae bacterium]MCF8282104.1 orotate phosphoribosyltransferase [Bacteroidales bacterium]MCF8312399.1 orotate phosphoribosyltransferase [Saprospiraceae bacterium]MCF8440604.1 orotate phosphoribosyltransferase [Saprospiraceae bacterium]